MSGPLFESAIPFEEARIRAAAIYCSDGRYEGWIARRSGERVAFEPVP